MRRNRKIKKLLSILCTISLITSVSCNLIACDNSALTSEKLAELKEKKSKIINGNKLEWIAPQEKTFNTVDNKWYVIIYRENENDNWEIIKFKNDEKIYFNKWKIIKKLNKYDIVLCFTTFGNNLTFYKTAISGIYKPGITGTIIVWEQLSNLIKAVYRWNGDGDPNLPEINFATGEIKY